jgi:WhiB family redox-sensing transcriptional regulator
MTALAPAEATTLGTWRFRAECRTADPRLFFPSSPVVGDRAKRVCSRCTVRDECLHHALAVGERHGIWGGTTADERQHMRKPTSESGGHWDGGELAIRHRDGA